MNEGSTIEADGNLTIAATTIDNRRRSVTTTQVQVSQSSGNEIVSVPGYSYYDSPRHIWSSTVYEDRVTALSPEARILSGRNLALDAATLNNTYSTIAAGGSIQNNVSTVNNQAAMLYRTTVTHEDWWCAFPFGTTCAGYGNHWWDYHPIWTSTSIQAIGSVPAVFSANQSITGVSVSFNNSAVGADGTVGSYWATLGVNQANGSVHDTGTRTSVSASSAGTSVGSTLPLPNLTLPQSGLYTYRASPSAPYLIETDPRFSSYTSFVSSDYMLSHLNLDPAMTHKRLGDGFYEQKLVTDQILELTGRRTLPGQASTTAEYQALMDAGLAAAQTLQLTPGIALTAAQIAALSSDIVWMVERPVTLPDGSTQRVLVPTVYLSPSHALLKPNGALVAANDISLDVGTLSNSGTLQSDAGTRIFGTDMTNRGVIASGGNLDLSVTNDLRNAGGTLSGRNVTLVAGRNFINETVTQRKVTTLTDTIGGDKQIIVGTHTQTDDFASARGSIVAAGNLSVTAGRDIRLSAGAINTGGDTVLDAGRNLDITTVTQTSRSDSRQAIGNAWNQTNAELSSLVSTGGSFTATAGNDLSVVGSKVKSGTTLTATAGGNLTVSAAKESIASRWSHDDGSSSADTRKSDETLNGSTLSAGQGISLSAGTGRTADLNVTASSISSDVGAATLAASGNVTLGSQTEDHSLDAHSQGTSKGFFSSSSSETSESSRSSIAVGSQISADRVAVVSGKDISVVGSNVVGTSDVNLSAQGEIAIEAAKNSQSFSYAHSESQSGFFSGGGLSVTLGKRSQNQTEEGNQTWYSGSLIGSVAGNVTLDAGKRYTQTASTVMAPQGDLRVTAQEIDIGAAWNQYTNNESHKTSFTGFSVGISSPVVDKAVAAYDAAKRSNEVKDDRLKALYAYRAARLGSDAATTAGSALADGKDPTGGVSLSVSLGSSKSESSSQSSGSQAVGSSLFAGNNLTLIATGNGQPETGNLSATGSSLTGHNVTLAAANDITLAAAQNTATSQSSNSSSGWSAGVSVGMSKDGAGVSAFANASRSSGNSNGDITTYSETQVQATGTLALESGRNTTLQGAQATGQTLLADVGRNLTLQSQQDSDTYHANQSGQSAGVSIGLTPGAKSGASFSASKGKTDSNYQSVQEQTGFYAGTGGFDITVKGNTDLTGAVIASAATPDKNRLTTGTLSFSDLQNHAEYSATSANFGIGIGFSGNRTATPEKAGSTAGNDRVSVGLGGMAVGDSDSASSTTRAAIAPGTLAITNPGAQKQDIAALSRDTTTANAPLQKIFDPQKVAEQMEFLQVAGEEIVKPVAAQAAKWIGDTFKQEGPAKTAAHAALGAAIGTLLGTGWESGAAGGALGDLLPLALEKAFEKDANGQIKDPEAFKAATAILSAALASAAGGDLAQTINAGMAAKNSVENNYLTHQQAQDKKTQLAAAKTPQEKAAIEAKYRKLDEAQKEAGADCLLNGNCQNVTDPLMLQGVLNDLKNACAPPRLCTADEQKSIAELKELFNTKDNAISPNYLLEETLLGGKAIDKLAGLLGVGVKSVAARVLGNTGEEAGTSGAAAYAQSAISAPRLANQLRYESANSPFKANGQLAQQAIDDAKLVMRPEELSNPAIPEGFGKYTTQTFQSPYGNFQVHFYKNSNTGEVFYGLDYKAVFNKMSGVNK